MGIARAFVSKPKVIFADEPTGNLDSKTSRQVLLRMLEMSKKEQITFVMVTHEPSLAACADRIITILDGQVQSDVVQSDAEKEKNRAELAEQLKQIEEQEAACQRRQRKPPAPPAKPLRSKPQPHPRPKHKEESNVKKPLRIVSIGMALMIWAGAFSLPALATATAETAQPQTQTQQTPPTSDGSGDTGNNSSSGSNNNQASSGGVYVTEAVVTTTAGGEVTEVHEGDRINVVLRMVDHPAATHNVTADEIIARVDSTIFTFTGPRRGQPAVPGGGRGRSLLHLRAAVPGCDLQRRRQYLQCQPELPEHLDGHAAAAQPHAGPVRRRGGDPQTPQPADAGVQLRHHRHHRRHPPFTLDVTAYATKGEESLSDVIVSVTLPDGITLTGGSLSTYVGTMAAGSTQKVSFNVLPSAAFTGGVANITVNLTGTGSETGTAVTGTGTISIPITQPDRFEITSVELSDSIFLGETTSVTVNVVNKGRDAVANLEASIAGDNLGVSVSNQYIGNVNPGTENSVDFDLTPPAGGRAVRHHHP